MTIPKLVLSSLLLLVHIAASLYYFGYSQTSMADSSTYYYDPLSWGPQPWALSTKLVTQICYVLKVGFDATYLDCFFIFQSVAFAGMMILARAFEDIEARIGVPERQTYWALLFLPSVNFWTAAIGKDAPMFFAISLSVWAMLSLRRRLPFFFIALAVMILFRAHIALMAALALAGASFFGSSASIGRKLGFFAVAMIGTWLTSGAVESSIGVDPTDPSAVADYLEAQNNVFSTIAGTTSIGDASYPVRIFSLLFRPLFIDAHGVLGLIASFENVGVILAVLYMIAHWRDVLHLWKQVPFVRYVLLFAFIVLLSLTLIYYNVGLGLRERVMTYPMIFSFLVALWSLRRKPQLPEMGHASHSLRVSPNPHRPVPEL